MNDSAIAGSAIVGEARVGIKPHGCLVLDGEMSLVNVLDVDMSMMEFQADLNVSIQTGGGLPEYTGPTEVTPTQETQVLETQNRSVLDNIIINPIPSNYGLITWNGSTLTVS